MRPWRATSYVATFDPVPPAVARARHLVNDVLHAAHVPDDVTDTAVLLVSELVTNSIRHATGSPRLDVAVDPDHLRVGVTDYRADRPPRVVARQDPDAESGRGLALVDALASTWGCDTRAPALKTVWFELAAT